MSLYHDIFVVPVRTANIDTYRRDAERFIEVWLEHGALSCVELEGDDVPFGKVTSFPRSVTLKDDEAVFAGIITYRDRAHRDAVNAKAMQDPRISRIGPDSASFDMQRMIFGGFKPFAGTSPTQTAQPYLFFRGRCEEAIEHYKSKLGAEVLMLLRFEDNPDKPGRDKIPAELDKKVMHAALRIAGNDIMMSDGNRSGAVDFRCMAVYLSVPNASEADHVFNALSAEGKIEMPIGPTFFAKRFGSVVDKFGVSWMVSVPLQ